MLITGGEGLYVGQSVEIYHPDRKSACKIHYLPGGRAKHTQDGSLLCGGKNQYTYKSCHRWNADTGAWDLVTESLKWFRQYHTSWTPENGSVTYLMGGSPSAYPSEVVDLDNGQVNESFPLQHPAFPLQ